jgi:acylglycerol lipase
MTEIGTSRMVAQSWHRFFPDSWHHTHDISELYMVMAANFTVFALIMYFYFPWYSDVRKGRRYRARNSPGMTSNSGFWLKCCSWARKEEKKERPIAIAFMCHGYGDYFHTDGYGEQARGLSLVAAELADRGVPCFGVEQQGCGRSEGTRCDVVYFEAYVDAVLQHAAIITSQEEYADVPCFLVGQSMGGAIAALAARKWNSRVDSKLHGLVMIAPMCAIDPSMVPKWHVMQALKLAAFFLPKAPLIPGDNKILHKCIKDEEIRKRAMADPLEYDGRTRLRMGLQCMRGCAQVDEAADQLECPLLLCHGGNDVVCPLENSKTFFSKAAAKDKTLNVYEGAWHAVLDEPGANGRVKVLNDISTWVSKRVEGEK